MWCVLFVKCWNSELQTNINMQAYVPNNWYLYTPIFKNSKLVLANHLLFEIKSFLRVKVSEVSNLAPSSRWRLLTCCHGHQVTQNEVKSRKFHPCLKAQGKVLWERKGLTINVKGWAMPAFGGKKIFLYQKSMAKYVCFI